MIKRILGVILSGVAIISLVACSPSTSKNENEIKVQESAKADESEKKFIGEGEWATDYTMDQVTQLNNEITTRMEEVCNFYGLEYIKDEKIKDENNESVNDKYVYFDNLDPEPNRMESMYYGFKTYGTDMARGSLNLKIGFKLDLDLIKNEDKFDLKETSISNFSEAMTNNPDRDYSEINENIIDIVKNQNANGTIETNLNGLVETITIKDDFLLYKIDSKTYNFKK
ncbi:hypothetical protein R0131_03830 [Clostridium sp. AL.422]|uniref:hypothetical protein n=1 Tax=Clostridium TaxID=1485 RepID=UPI00293DF646|nr:MULTISPECIES: hypothetical protein [unclassified Clostridium]MDV4149958.1 hypothetical protein [Clostridium sp. AL.422]